jgi:SAM-dependent methyltransferase
MNVNEQQMEALYQATYALERCLMPPIPDATEFFAYDPLPWAIFLPLIEHAADLTEGRRFLDVGCGIGTKLAYMRYLGWEVAGIERHEPYAQAARVISEAEVAVADVFEVETFDADVVYSYRLGVTEETQGRVEAHLLGRMRPGAVLVLPTRPPEVRVA